MFKKLQDFLLGKVGCAARIAHLQGTKKIVSHPQGKNQPADASSPAQHNKSTFSKRVLQTPLLMDTPHGCGGVQGLGWFLARLLVDEDGDVADSFMVEDDEQHNMQHVDKVLQVCTCVCALYTQSANTGAFTTRHINNPTTQLDRRQLQGAELFVEAGDVMVLTDA